MSSKSYVVEQFLFAKNMVDDKLANDDYEGALVEAELAAQIATMYPILYNFVDDELEQTLIKEYKSRCGEIKLETKTKNVLFYNSQIANRGALTQQYLDYLISRNYKVLFVIPYKKNTLHGDEIMEQVKSIDNVELFIPKGNDYTSRMKSLRSRISDFKPGKTFIHLLPYDVLGFSLLANLKSSLRYYIVHNDHTFWLGKYCADYFIEFRDFGQLIAVQRRGIKQERILKCPYYPITKDNNFLGFPFERKGKVIVLLASNPYKFMMDSKRTLLSLIRDVLIENENLILVVAGRATKELHKYVKEHNLIGRVISLGQRADFFSLMKEVDIYINSYPLIGGLTTQFAVEAGIPVVTFTSSELKSTNWSEDLISHCNLKLTFTNKNDFKNRLSNLVQNQKLRLSFKDKNNIFTFSKEDFENKLDKLLLDQKSNTIEPILSELSHDDETFLDYYLQREHDLNQIRKDAYRKFKTEKLFGESPYILKFKLKKFLKKYKVL